MDRVIKSCLKRGSARNFRCFGKTNGQVPRIDLGVSDETLWLLNTCVPRTKSYAGYPRLAMLVSSGFYRIILYALHSVLCVTKQTDVMQYGARPPRGGISILWFKQP